MDHLAALEREVVAMAAALRTADPARPVASCPEWDVQALTNHVAAVHRWALGALQTEGSPPYDESRHSTPDDYAEAADALVARLRKLPADAPCWTFNKADRTARFWRRRQLQEVSVHRWDVAQHGIDPDVAADGIREVVEFFLPRQLATGRTAVPDGTVVLTAGDRSWTLAEGDGPRVVVTADTPTLNLLLWGRRTLDDVGVEGDPAFAKGFFDCALTP